MQTAHVQKAVMRVLNGCTALPIPIEAIVKSLGIRLLPFELGDETSGVLVKLRLFHPLIRKEGV